MANPSRTGARTVVAIDFGTTYTGVAWALVKGSQRPGFEDVRVFSDWPNGVSPKVPSEISFSPSPSGKAQWGYDIEQPGSQVVRYAKLELQCRSPLLEIQQLADVVKGLRLMARFRVDDEAGARNDVPKYLMLSTEGIVTEFLDRVVRWWFANVHADNAAFLATNPLDLIITHPGEWSYEARNKTVRSVLAAFPKSRFPTRRFVSVCSEPEASALYTSMSASRGLRGRLYPGDCFVICDAGGGTVDLLAYEMRSRQPFEIVPLTKARSLHCGANSIDKRCLAFLQRILRDLDVETSDVGTGGHDVLGPVAETLLGRFIEKKYAFDNMDTAEIQLPRSCRDKVRPDPWAQAKVVNNTLRLTREDLEEIFDPAVTEITTNLARQVAQAELCRDGQVKKVTHIFMVGGFSENPYLFRKVKDWAKLTQIEVERGDDTWGAVVRGAVLKGAGIGASLPPVVGICPRHYGIICNHVYRSHLDHDDAELYVSKLTGETVARRQILWMVHKGDLIVPGEPIVEEMGVAVSFTKSEEVSGKGGSLSFIASHYDESPSQLSELPAGEEQIVLTFKYSDIPKSARGSAKRADKGLFTYYRVSLKVVITVAEEVQIEVIAGGKVLNTRNTSL